jgi:CRP/FNR family cyclic AMP-dependent transcriptional regulator
MPMENSPDLIESIKTVRHFRNLSLLDLHKIVSSGQIRRYNANAAIFTESDPCAGMFVLMIGRVHLFKTGPQGQINIMAIIDPVIMFNEVAALDGGANPLTAIAIENCRVWQISHESFQELIERIPQVGLSLLQVLARRNREMITHNADLSFHSVVARTAKLLLILSNNGQLPINRRQCSIEEMASRVATVPEAISRSLNTIKSLGTIRVNRTEIIIVSPGKLAELAHITPPPNV